MKGDCVSDFRDGHGEQGFDIETGRSTSPTHVHMHEPIYQYACRQLGLTRTMAAWLDTQGWRIYALPNSVEIREFELRNYRRVVSGYLTARWVRQNDEPCYVGDGADTLVNDMHNFDPDCRVTAHRSICDGHECEEPHLHHDDHDTNAHFAGGVFRAIALNDAKKGELVEIAVEGTLDPPPPASDVGGISGFVSKDTGDHMKKDDNKPRFELLPAEPLFALADLYTQGAKKYRDRGWEEGMSWGRVFGAMCRHAWKFWRGEDYDQETGAHHMIAVAWNAFALYTYAVRKLGTDDRPSA